MLLFLFIFAENIC